MSITISYPFTTEGNYTFDSDKIELVGGKAQLKLTDLPGQSFNQPFDSDVGFVYDSDKAEFVGGKVQQKDQRSYSGATFEASYNTDINGTRGAGVLTGTPIGGAGITGNKLDLTGGGKCVNYDADLNADSQQTGCVKFKATPDYTGAPPSDRPLYTNCKANGDADNMIMLRHNSSGNIQLFIEDQAGGNIMNVLLGLWNNVAGTEYEFGLNYSLTTGESRLFVENKVTGICEQLGATQAGTGIRDANISFFNIGGNYNNVQFFEGYISDLVIFDTVQNIVDYPAGGYIVPDNIYAATNVTLPENHYTGAGTIQTIDSMTTTEVGTPRYTIQIGRSGNYLYWDSSAWEISDGTYAQANDITTFNTNAPTIDIEGEVYGQVKINFTDSDTISDVSDLTLSPTGQIYPIDNPTIETNTVFRGDQLLSFVAIENKTGSDELKYILKKDSSYYYFDSSNWVVSNGTYAQSNTAVEIETNKAGFLTEGSGKNVKVKVFLHSDSGLTTPDIDDIEILYDFSGDSPTLFDVTIWGYLRNLEQALEGEIIKVKPVWTYGDKTIISDDYIQVTTGTNGYWEMDMIIEDVNPQYLYWIMKNERIKTNFLSGVHSFGELTIQ